MGVCETGPGPALQGRAAPQHRERSARSAHGNQVSCLEPGGVRVQGGVLTCPCHPPCSVYSTGFNLTVSPLGLPPSPGEGALALSAGLWETAGGVTFPSPSESLGWESRVFRVKGLLRLEKCRQSSLGEGAAAGAGTLLGGSATKQGTVFSV